MRTRARERESNRERKQERVSERERGKGERVEIFFLTTKESHHIHLFPIARHKSKRQCVRLAFTPMALSGCELAATIHVLHFTTQYPQGERKAVEAPQTQGM